MMALQNLFTSGTMLDVAFAVLADVQLFFENYGWYVLAVVVLTVAIYYKAIRPAVESVKEDKKLKQQKKFGWYFKLALV